VGLRPIMLKPTIPLHFLPTEKWIGSQDLYRISCLLKKQFSYQSVYCCLIRYFLVRIRTAKFFTNSTKRFRDTPCSYLLNCIATGMSSGLATKMTLGPVSQGIWVSLLHGVELFIILFLHGSTWLLLGCV